MTQHDDAPAPALKTIDASARHQVEPMPSGLFAVRDTLTGNLLKNRAGIVGTYKRRGIATEVADFHNK